MALWYIEIEKLPSLLCKHWQMAGDDNSFSVDLYRRRCQVRSPIGIRRPSAEENIRIKWKKRGTRESYLIRSSMICKHHQMSLGWSGNVVKKGRACGTPSRVKYLQSLIKKNCKTLFAWNTQCKWSDNIKMLRRIVMGVWNRFVSE